MTLFQFKQQIQKQQTYYHIAIIALVIFNAIFIYFFIRHQGNYFGSGFIVGITLGFLYVLTYLLLHPK